MFSALKRIWFEYLYIFQVPCHVTVGVSVLQPFRLTLKEQFNFSSPLEIVLCTRLPSFAFTSWNWCYDPLRLFIRSSYREYATVDRCVYTVYSIAQQQIVKYIIRRLNDLGYDNSRKNKFFLPSHLHSTLIFTHSKKSTIRKLKNTQ